MRLVIISDTHGYLWQENDLPDGDALIHCGDVSLHSTEREIQTFASWMDGQRHENKIVIAGNHDKYMSSKWFKNTAYLQDSSIIIDGYKFYGSPWTPTFFSWYWMKDRGEQIARMWRKIPDDTDVLITHGPPAQAGRLGKARCVKTGRMIDVGCNDLTTAVDRVKPSVHCFGHIHEGYGEIQKSGTRFINAALAMSGTMPVVVDI